MSIYSNINNNQRIIKLTKIIDKIDKMTQKLDKVIINDDGEITIVVPQYFEQDITIAYKKDCTLIIKANSKPKVDKQELLKLIMSYGRFASEAFHALRISNHDEAYYYEKIVL